MSHHLRLMAIPALFVTMALPMAAMAHTRRATAMC